MIVEARADQGSMDPIEIITRPGNVEYSDAGDTFSLEVGSDNDTRFRASCGKTADGPIVRGAQEWVEANDYIYWRNGICDRTFYDAGMAHPRMRLLDPADLSIDDDTRWSQFIDPNPRNVIAYENAIEFAMSPWWNIDTVHDEIGEPR